MKEFKFNKKTNNLFTAIIGLQSIKEAECFFRDLCTIEEIRDMAERFEIARLVDQGFSYRTIATNLKTSTTTVSRVASWLSNGKGGYRTALNKINNLNHQSSDIPRKG